MKKIYCDILFMSSELLPVLVTAADFILVQPPGLGNKTIFSQLLYFIMIYNEINTKF